MATPLLLVAVSRLFLAAPAVLLPPQDPPAEPRLELGGRIFLDRVDGRASTPDEPGLRFRSARLQAWAHLAAGLTLRGQVELRDSEVNLLEVYARVRGPLGTWQVGQQREPGGLEAMSALSTLAFPERSTPSQALTPGRNLGLTWRTRQGAFSVAGGVFRESDEVTLEPEGETHSASLRLGLTRRDSGTGDLAHVGAWSSLRDAGDGALRFRGRPGARYLPRLVDTGALAGARAWTGGLEAAWQRGGWTLAGEVLGARVTPEAGEDATLVGSYAQVSWRPGGEPYSWVNSRSAFHGVAPPTGQAVLELALRVARTRLDDGSLSGGSQRDIGAGLNLTWARRTRWMLHYLRARTDEARAEAVLLRFQVSW